MDNIPEREQPKPERIVSLGEDFSLFDPEYTILSRSQNEVTIFKSPIKLNLENNLQTPLNIHALTSPTYKGESITPFDPELGYQIDSEDLKLETRVQKMKRLHDVLNRKIDFSKAPLYLAIYKYDFDSTYRLNLNEESKRDSVVAENLFSQEMFDLLKRLRALVSFPEGKGAFEAKSSLKELEHGSIMFDNFYPIDSGPLPTPAEDAGIIREGFNLFLPSDPGKLSQIKARFVLAEEQPEEIQS